MLCHGARSTTQQAVQQAELSSAQTCDGTLRMAELSRLPCGLQSLILTTTQHSALEVAWFLRQVQGLAERIVIRLRTHKLWRQLSDGPGMLLVSSTCCQAGPELHAGYSNAAITHAAGMAGRHMPARPSPLLTSCVSVWRRPWRWWGSSTTGTLRQTTGPLGTTLGCGSCSCLMMRKAHQPSSTGDACAAHAPDACPAAHTQTH